MIILLHKNFKKKYKKLSKSNREKFKERVGLFLHDSSHSQLNDHSLHGEYSHQRSFNVTGDLRVLYERVQKETVLFIDIDTHSNLYGR